MEGALGRIVQTAIHETVSAAAGQSWGSNHVDDR